MLKKIAVTATLLFACASALAGAGALTVTSNSKPITVYPGQPFVISLPSNPSTGYSWQLAPRNVCRYCPPYPGYDINLVTLISHKFVAAKTNRMGAPGREEWTFSAVKPTTPYAVTQVGHISLKYVRSWENKKAPVTNFIVHVKAGS